MQTLMLAWLANGNAMQYGFIEKWLFSQLAVTTVVFVIAEKNYY